MSSATPSIAEVIRSGGVDAVYQPVVRLADRRAVGYEALARGPRGSRLERPDALFAAAREEGLEAELDAECRRAALRGAAAAELGPHEILFVNLEPGSAGEAGAAELRDATRGGDLGCAVVLELTERALTRRPMELLGDVGALRAAGASLALDDLGADPRSVALMPIVSAEVLKLDLGLVQDSPTARGAEVVHAVGAESERGGAVVLAEGIETEENLRRGRALGAELGQGWLFGRPGPLPGPADRPRADWSLPRRMPFEATVTPFEVVAAVKPTRRADKRLLFSLSLAIESQTTRQGSAAVVLGTFQEDRFFTAPTAARYRVLADSSALVGVLGAGLSPVPVDGVRGVSLDMAEPLRGEWNVVVLGPHFSAALVGRDLGDAGPDMDRRFDFALTYDRDLVAGAARATMTRMAAAG